MLRVSMDSYTLRVTCCLQTHRGNPSDWRFQEPACSCNPAACAAGKAAQEMDTEPDSAGGALAAGGMPDAVEEDVELAQRQDLDADNVAEADEVDVVGKAQVSSVPVLSCVAGCCMTIRVAPNACATAELGRLMLQR